MKKKAKDIVAANKWFLLSIVGMVIIPIALLIVAVCLFKDNFSFASWDAINTLFVVFIVVLGVELILATVYVATYKKRETAQEIRQETKIEEKGRLHESADESEKSLFDSVMRDVVQKKNFVLMTRPEIIEFCEKLNYNLETQVELRQYDDSPDNISAGDRIYCFLYETQGLIKLVVKNHSLYIDSLRINHPNIAQVAKVSDWYEILLDDTFTDNEKVKEILISSYEFVVGSNYSLINGRYVMKHESVDTDGEAEQVIVESVKEPDKNVEAILIKKQKLSELTLTTREAIADYVEANLKGDCTPYVIRRKGFALYSLKAQNLEKLQKQYKSLTQGSQKPQSRSYGLLYEREGVVKMLLRFDPEFARAKMKIHPTLTRARFPKGKDWYSMILDETFDEDVKISELVLEAYNYMCEEYFKVK